MSYGKGKEPFAIDLRIQAKFSYHISMNIQVGVSLFIIALTVLYL
jgi:hypothetical protein